MLSVILRTQNGENLLVEALRPLIAAAAEGVVRDVVFLDLGSSDGTAQIADAAGAAFLRAPASMPEATRAALAAAHRADWMLLLDQATVLAPGWLDETIAFVERQERVKTANRQLSAAFRPEDEPEMGSADLGRRIMVLAANRLISVAKLSQGILVRRRDLTGTAAPPIDWRAGDPSIKLVNLLRLRSRTHLAQPLDVPEKSVDESEPSRLPSTAL